MMTLREVILQVIRDWWNTWGEDTERACDDLAEELTLILSTRPTLEGRAPFAYRVTHEHHGHVGVFRRLREAVAAARQHGEPDNLAIFACHNGGREESVASDRYSRPNPPRREEALAFIRERADRIRQARANRPDLVSFHELRGIFRCLPDDPEDKQVADYIASAPCTWLTPEEVRDEP